jgi:hypothetical protein
LLHLISLFVCMTAPRGWLLHLISLFVCMTKFGLQYVPGVLLSGPHK